MSPALSLLLVAAVAVAARVAVRLVHREVRSSDTLSHLVFVRSVRRLGWRGTAARLRTDYPYGYHFLVSRLPERWMDVWERINGAVFDTLHVLLFAAVLGWSAPELPADVRWLWGPLLLALSPAWLYTGSGPRAYDATERVFGELLGAVVFTSLWRFDAGGGWGWWLLALAVAAYLLNTSKFGAQVLLFFCVVLGALERSLPILVLPFVAGAAAHLASGGLYGRILRGQVIHLRWYAGAVRRDGTPIARRNSWPAFRAAWKRGGWRAALYYLLIHQSVAIGLLHHVPLAFVLGTSLLGIGRAAADPFAVHWLMAAGAAWLLTSLRPLLFLGEAERYLYFAAIPEFLVIAGWVATAPPAGRWALLAYCVAWWGVQQGLHWLKWRAVRREDPTARRELIAFLRTLPPRRMLTFSDMYLAAELAYRTEHAHFIFDPRLNVTVSWKDVFAFYPYPKWAAVEALDSELAVVDKKGVATLRRDGVELDFPFERLPLLFENERYAAYAVEREAAPVARAG